MSLLTFKYIEVFKKKRSQVDEKQVVSSQGRRKKRSKLILGREETVPRLQSSLLVLEWRMTVLIKSLTERINFCGF